ncbi:MAG TPA: ATP-binding protein [Bryobacteraceae bacterium]|nr:ATP-binding protein [Bryobacteraceae bacterium]
MNNTLHHRAAGRYGAAALAVAVALVVRTLMGTMMGEGVPFITFFPAVVFASWYGGLGPGLFSTALSTIAALFLLMTPTFSFGLVRPQDGFNSLLFAVLGVFISILNDQRQRAMNVAAARLEQIENEVKERRAAEREAEEARRWSSDTLASIGDAVICTDVDGRVTYLNRAAEELTEWSFEEAKGIHVEKVFQIYNEYTGAPAVNPVWRVLQEGLVVGLANHTVLRARSGKEIPIDDSGAPIQSEGLKIIGAVLVFRDMTERKETEEKLRRAAQQLAQSNRDLSDFAHAVSHDLQEPLRAIGSFSALLSRKYKGQLDGDADEYLAFMSSSAERMSRMIRDLLSFSRAVNSTSPFGTLRLTDAVNWAQQNLQELVRETGARITYGDLPSLQADHIQMVQLFQNLIGNAVNYRSEQTPEIMITAEDQTTHWLISVRDNGRGIAESDREKIFRLFGRGDSRVPGSGIGLAICKRIVERHGGQIWVAGNEPGGSTFQLTISKALKTELGDRSFEQSL